MGKRGAEDTLLIESPTKRRYFRPRSSVAVRLESMASTGGVSPPPLLALLKSHCRKRPHFFEGEEKAEEAACFRRPLCESKKLSADVSTEPISGSYQDSSSSSSTVRVLKRPRVDLVASEAVLSTVDDKPVEDTHTEDCVYNSFQFWRVPLPELDLSLLETKNELKVNDSSFDAMET